MTDTNLQSQKKSQKRGSLATGVGASERVLRSAGYRYWELFRACLGPESLAVSVTHGIRITPPVSQRIPSVASDTAYCMDNQTSKICKQAREL